MDWTEAHERLRAPLYAPLHAAIVRLPRDRWPGHAELTALAAGATTSRGVPVRFVDPAGLGDHAAYEVHIATTGEVPTRERNWHDLFNALAWVAWPRAKASLNAQHVRMLAQRGPSEARLRSPERDALTLFDEGGVAVASSDPALLRLIVQFAWKELFWHRRDEVRSHMRFFAFGHACCEQALAPYLGMVAKTVFVPVQADFLAASPDRQVALIDTALATHFEDPRRFATPRAMAPLPLLGIPGWHPDTAHEAFYDRTDYFHPPRPRPGREAGPQV